jgi:poly-gamma-glutamate synthesis protein (capsule biosynthesis protein)
MAVIVSFVMDKSALLKLIGAVTIILVGATLYQFSKVVPAMNSLTEENFASALPKPSSTPIAKKNTISLIFAGDIMLDRNIRTKAKQNGYDFLLGPRLSALLKSSDYTVANLEGPITDNQSVSVGSAVGSTSNFIFTFAPESTTFLKDHSITIVNLGNNHILNFGPDGLAQTYSYLDAAAINYFGFTGDTQPENSETYILDHDGYKIGFVNYNQFIVNGDQQVFADIKKIKPNVDYLIVYTHWGNEYVQENTVLINLAHEFVDAGAHLVIGSHPHIITGNEIYQGSPIYYSLGNFIFDQYFDEDVKKGKLVKATINSDTNETSLEEFIVGISPNGQTELR